MSRPVVIYHGNCLDGFTAAWAAYKKFGTDADYIAGYYQQPLGYDLEDRPVYVVDFSFKRKELEEMLSSPTGPMSVTILDHHKSAFEEMEGFEHPKLDFRFNINKSGAVLAWEFFHPKVAVPKFVEHVQDRDLWRFQLPGTREINAYMYSFDMTFLNWNLFSESQIGRMVDYGKQIVRSQMAQMKIWVAQHTFEMTICGFKVPATNCPSPWASEIGNMLSDGYPFSVSFFIDGDCINFSLRSSKDGGEDVSAIAKRFGGGGHRNAAGFRLTKNQAVTAEIDGYILFTS